MNNRPNAPVHGERLLRAGEVAKILDVPVGTIHEAAQQCRMAGIVRVGRVVRFDSATLEGWIADGGQALPGGWRQAPMGPSA